MVHEGSFGVGQSPGGRDDAAGATEGRDVTSPGYGRGIGSVLRKLSGRYALLNMEPMTGIEPAYSAWEADVLPLNYIGAVASKG